MAEDRNNIDKDETKINSGSNQSMGNPSNSNQSNDDEYEKICSICHRPESKAGKMIQMGMGMYVCPDCMQRSMDTIMKGDFNYDEMMKLSKDMPGIHFMNMSDLMGDIPQKQKIKKKKEGEKKVPLINLKDIPAPHKIKEKLDEYVIGQEYAKKVISVAVYNHYKRVATDTMDSIEIEKSNMLMIGPTGSGKTYLVKTLARLLNVPLAIADATSLTEAGYIGDDIESVVSKLLAAAGNDVEKAEQGIIFIDEIDKIAKKKETRSRDVSGESVQQGMLKLLEGADIEVPVGSNSKNAMVPMVTVNTKNILFICGGAFDGLEKIIESRQDTKSIGFGAEVSEKEERNVGEVLKEVMPEDFIKFGLIPEFIGRVPVVVTLDSLDEEALIRILKEPKNSLTKQYDKLFELDGVELEFQDEALEIVARKSLERKTGARGLRSIMEHTLMDLMYRTPSDDTIRKCIITKEAVEGTGEAEIIHGEAPAPVKKAGHKTSRSRKKGKPETA